MLKIIGTQKEIKHIKSVLWCSSDCPVCENPEMECKKGTRGCDDIDIFYNCIESNIAFEIKN